MLHFARWKIAAIIVVCFGGLIFALPNVLTAGMRQALPDWMPSDTINLGLDLQGGSHLLLEVEHDAVMRERLETLVEDIRSGLRQERIRYTGLGIRINTVTVRIPAEEDRERAADVIRDLGAPVSSNLLGGFTGTSDISVEIEPSGTILTRLTEEAVNERRRAAVQQSIEIVRRRIDELGTREPTIQRQGDNRILVQVPGLEDPERLKDLLGKTAKLVFRLVDTSASVSEAMNGRVPPGSELLEADDDPNQKLVVRKRIMVSGENLVDAQPATDQQTNEPIVTFRFDTVGGKRFADVTKENVGRPFAIVLDGKVVSAPVIRTPILGGAGQIEGGFTFQEANDLAILLRAGALPAPLTIIEERTVGAELGEDSVRAGEIAAIIGFSAVIGFMFLSYGLFGLYANVALIMNMVLIGGALSLLQATLTLPGIAGIVLTIGMAVDANVLIFERIREEVFAGRTPISAVEAGYRRALGTILDANITTFIAAVILFQIGSGPVRGFAVTLAIGIITSVFTAFTLTRLVVSTWLRARRPARLAV